MVIGVRVGVDVVGELDTIRAVALSSVGMERLDAVRLHPDDFVHDVVERILRANVGPTPYTSARGTVAGYVTTVARSVLANWRRGKARMLTVLTVDGDIEATADGARQGPCQDPHSIVKKLSKVGCETDRPPPGAVACPVSRARGFQKRPPRSRLE